MSISTDANHTATLEYRIPECLLHTMSEEKWNIIQFRIPVNSSMTIENVMKQVVEEAAIVTGTSTIPEKILNTLKESTQNYLNKYFSLCACLYLTNT